MNIAYNQARRDGWLAPLAVIIAAYRERKQIAASIRAIPPIGAAVIFAIAFIAGMIGSVSAVLIAAGFLAGIQLSTRTITVKVPVAPPALPSHAVNGHAPVVATAEAVTAFGLPVSEVKFKQPAPARPVKQAAVK